MRVLTTNEMATVSGAVHCYSSEDLKFMIETAQDEARVSGSTFGFFAGAMTLLVPGANVLIAIATGALVGCLVYSNSEKNSYIFPWN